MFLKEEIFAGSQGLNSKAPGVFGSHDDHCRADDPPGRITGASSSSSVATKIPGIGNVYGGDHRGLFGLTNHGSYKIVAVLDK
jgi:hypothetical protein